MKTLVHLQPARVDGSRIDVPFRLEQPDIDSSVVGLAQITDTGHRVWVETSIDGRVILSGKLEPNNPENDFDVLRAETSRIEAFTLPLPITSLDGVAAVLHAYVSGGRPEWG